MEQWGNSEGDGGFGISAGRAERRREQLKKTSGVAYAGMVRRRESSVAVGKDRRDAAVRAKRMRRSFPEAAGGGGGMEGMQMQAEGEGGIHGEGGILVEDSELTTAGVSGGISVGDVSGHLSARGESAVVPTSTTSTEPGVLDTAAANEEIAKKAVENLRTSLRGQSSEGASGGKRLKALRDLRRVLSASDEPPLAAAVEARVVPLLCQCLGFGVSPEELLEAAWCVTNIASGDAAATSAALPAAPLLITHCSGDATMEHVAEQCCWALGNFAADSSDLRMALLDQGALPALARLLSSCGRDSIHRSPSFCRTVAWAVSSLIKGPDARAAAELLKYNGVASAIVKLLSKTQDTETAAEAAWVAVYACALSEASAAALEVEGMGKQLLQLMAVLPSSDVVTLTPVVRAIGNFCGGDSARIDQLFASQVALGDGEAVSMDQSVLGTLPSSLSQTHPHMLLLDALSSCLSAPHRSLQKDAAWALANISAGTEQHKQAVWSHSSCLSSLIGLLHSAPFDLRLEAAYALANLCVASKSREGKVGSAIAHAYTERIQHLADEGCVKPFLDLIRVPSVDASRLGLQFTEMVLRLLPHGPELVEKADGIDALETLQFNENADLSTMSNFLVNKYFGEDYGL